MLIELIRNITSISQTVLLMLINRNAFSIFYTELSKAMMTSHEELKSGLFHLFQGIEVLKNAFPNRKFTIDGRLVGDIGEIIAALEYDLKLDVISQADYDATCSQGRRIQIKATFQDALTFKRTPDFFLGFKLYQDGTFEEIFNGPGNIIFDRYQHRKGIGDTLLRFPNSALRQMSAAVPAHQKIRLRK